ILFLFLSSPLFSEPTMPLFRCDRGNLDRSSSDQLLRIVSNHPFYSLANKRSSLVACRVSANSGELRFNLGDVIRFDFSDVSPGAEIILSSGIRERRAYTIGMSALSTLTNQPCVEKNQKPTQTRENKEMEQKTKVYWCSDLAAFSITINKNGQAQNIRAWMVH
ncbi:MAG: hypothetical protein COW78_05990, partial [Bdellovibrio sp. CG22_combo_CG10-13_8_21_14_all_39_27]